MAKKLLGERQIGDVVYNAGQILTDEDFAKSGLQESDVRIVNEAADAPVAAQETAAAPADKDAEVDAQASSEKKEEEQSSQAGSEAAASDAGSESGASSTEGTTVDETVEHVLTEQDLIDNPALVEQGLKAGDTVRIKPDAAV